MFTSRARGAAALAVATAFLAAACGSSAKSSSPTTTTAAKATAQASTAGSLKGVCPDNIVIQTDWFATPERAAAYQLIGPNGTVDASKGAYTGPLGDTGVNL